MGPRPIKSKIRRRALSCARPAPMRLDIPDLPIVSVLPELLAAVARHPAVLLEAPPGAGKSTVVPLALAAADFERIVMLEPRRLAARAVAARMASTLGE